MSVVVRATVDPADLIPLLRREVAALDNGLPLGDIEMMDDVIASSGAVSRTTFMMFLLGVAACVAVLLGSVGIYGVISYVVSQRTSEIGVRVALGARSSDIQSQVLTRGMAPAVIGVVLGLGSAALMSRLLASFLFEVDAYDPLTFIAAPIAFLLVAAAACVLPARSATSADPAAALRSD
jgi:ABC-type antimicrobial peptide transport system permease subunit